VELDEVKQGGSVGALGKLRDKLAGAWLVQGGVSLWGVGSQSKTD
jgi:hypothetical protein